MSGTIAFAAASLAWILVVVSPVAAQTPDDAPSEASGASAPEDALDAERGVEGGAAEDVSDPSPSEQRSATGVDLEDTLDDPPPGADPPGADDTFEGDPDHALLDEDAPVESGTDPAWVVAAGAVTGLAALAAVAAVISWTYREGHVSRFNSDECVSATMTREELCYESAYVPGQQAEITTAVAAGVAGAAAVTALVLFLVAPSRSAETEAAGWSCGAGPGALGLACGARF